MQDSRAFHAAAARDELEHNENKLLQSSAGAAWWSGNRYDWWDMQSNPDNIYLETERLLLREFTVRDVDNLCDLDGDSEVLRFINGGVPTPRAVIETKILPHFMSFYRRYAGMGFWAAHEKTSGEFIGWFALHPEDGRAPDDLALGYRLKRKFWRKGYGSEGARALIDKAFRELGAARVFACTYSENLGSRGVMEKSGLKLVRTYRMSTDELDNPMTYVASDAVWPSDDVEYALARAGWEATVSAE
jgi:RimJ/RimL family protein N-acetyltransferase